jgi:opacity protein-like surface antigen
MAAMAGGGFGVYGTYMDMADMEDPGLGGGIKFQADIAEEVLGFELRLGAVTDYDSAEAKDSYLATVEANLTLGMPLGDKARIYVGAGGGYYVFPEFESDIAMGGSLEPNIDPDDVFGFFAVAGIELMFNPNFGIFVEAKYLVAEIDEMDIDGVTVDVDEGDFGGFGVNAGLLFRF